MKQLFKGKRTYIVAAIAVVIGTLRVLDIINEQTYNDALVILAPLGLATLRSALK